MKTNVALPESVIFSAEIVNGCVASLLLWADLNHLNSKIKPRVYVRLITTKSYIWRKEK